MNTASVEVAESAFYLTPSAKSTELAVVVGRDVPVTVIFQALRVESNDDAMPLTTGIVSIKV